MGHILVTVLYVLDNRNWKTYKWKQLYWEFCSIKLLCMWALREGEKPTERRFWLSLVAFLPPVPYLKSRLYFFSKQSLTHTQGDTCTHALPWRSHTYGCGKYVNAIKEPSMLMKVCLHTKDQFTKAKCSQYDSINVFFNVSMQHL